MDIGAAFCEFFSAFFGAWIIHIQADWHLDSDADHLRGMATEEKIPVGGFSEVYGTGIGEMLWKSEKFGRAVAQIRATALRFARWDEGG